MNDIEKSYEALIEEMYNKVEKATRLLEEASLAFQEAKNNSKPRDHDAWDDLRRAVKDFCPIEDTKGWNTSSWCIFPDDN